MLINVLQQWQARQADDRSEASVSSRQSSVRERDKTEAGSGKDGKGAGRGRSSSPAPWVRGDKQ
eukprot:10393435-Alexandrium_andersonii.AAC.1